MSERSAWIDVVGRLIARLAASDVRELELTRVDFRVRLRRRVGPAELPVVRTGSAPAEPSVDLVEIKAPFTGVFYRASTPTARAYVQEGDFVEPETVVGLIETMKIFNEVTADCSGRVTRIVATSGQLVHAGDPLMLVDPGQRPGDQGWEPGAAG